MSDPIVDRIQPAPQYLALRKKRNRLGVVGLTLLTLLVLLVYYGYIALIAFFGASVTSLGIPIGMAVIAFTIVITGVYVRRLNGEFNTLIKKILKDAAK